MRKAAKQMLSLVLALVMCLSLPVCARADEIQYPRDRVGKIAIYTTETETTTWEALLHEQSSEEYTIYMKPEDVAAITGTTLVWNTRYNMSFIRDNYEVCVDMYNGAWIELHVANSDTMRLYGKFQLDDVLEYTDEEGETMVYVPLEKILYLLNASWYADNDIVYVCPVGDNLLDLLADWTELCQGIPTYGEVVGESLGEILGNSFKYSLLAVADELDARVVISGNLFQNDKTEEALLELSQPVISRMSSSEANVLDSPIYRLNPGYEELLKRAENVSGLSNILEGDTGETISQRICETVTKWTPEDLGSDFAAVFKVAGTAGKAFKVVETAVRSGSWTEDYVAQLEYLSTMQEKHWYDDFSSDQQTQIRSAAESLYSEYGNALGNAIWEGGKELLNKAADIVLESVGGVAYMVKQGYDAGLTILRTMVPAVDSALVSGDYAMRMKCEYNIAMVTASEYLKALDEIAEKGITQDRLDTARMLGELVANASGHCYYNLYILKDQEQYLTKAQNAAVYVTRLNNAAQYDARLDLRTDFGNLYSGEQGSVRERIPREYVKFPADQVIVSTHYIEGEGDGYTYRYPLPRVYTPGNTDLQKTINYGEAMVSLVEEAQAWIDMLEDADTTRSLYYYMYMESAYATSGFLAMKFTGSAYLGGTHPVSSTFTILIDLTTGQKLTLTQMLDPDNTDAGTQLVNAVASALTADYGNAVFGVDGAAERILTGSASWTLDSNGLTVQYAPGDIAPYVNGYITVVIPLSALTGILAEEYLPKEIQGDGQAVICRETDSIVSQVDYHFGDDSPVAVATRGRIDYVTVWDENGVVMYANYLENSLVWLPEAEEYKVSYNGGEQVTMKP